MTHVLTFVSSGKKPLTKTHLKEAEKILYYYDTESTGEPVWLCKKRAADLPMKEKPSSVLLIHVRDELAKDKIDVFSVATENRRKKLLVADMDSTIVRGETLDELADFAGIKDQIADITARAMEGELDFEAALKERVALLKGLSETSLKETLKTLSTNPGAEALVDTMKKHGATCVLVSGGFTFFTESVATLVGFDHHHGNVLGVDNGELTGTVGEPILTKDSKVMYLNQYAQELGITSQDAITIGDGANDIPMLKTAGMGVGYRPKDAVAREVDNIIVHGSLAAALYIQGYSDKDWA